MTLKYQFLLAILISVALVGINVNFAKENALQTFLIWSGVLAAFVLIPVTLLWDKAYPVKTDSSGSPVKYYLEQANKRRKIGIYLFYVCIAVSLGALGLTTTGIVNDDSFLAPFVMLLPFAGYIVMTRKCPYCYRANKPKTDRCVSCNNFIDFNGF